MNARDGSGGWLAPVLPLSQGAFLGRVVEDGEYHLEDGESHGDEPENLMRRGVLLGLYRASKKNASSASDIRVKQSVVDAKTRSRTHRYVLAADADPDPHSCAEQDQVDAKGEEVKQWPPSQHIGGEKVQRRHTKRHDGHEQSVGERRLVKVALDVLRHDCTGGNGVVQPIEEILTAGADGLQRIHCKVAYM